MRVKLLLERQSIKNRFNGEAWRKSVIVDIPDTDNTEAEEKGIWQIMGYVEIKEGEK